MDYKEYIVSLKKKIDLEKFYEDMELLGGEGNTPDRPVSCACKRPISRNTHYMLTAEEVKTLEQDARVLAVELTAKEKGIFPSIAFEQTESNWDKSESIASTHKNWGLLRCIEGEQRVGWGYDDTSNQSGSIQVNSSGKNVDVVIVDEGHFITDHPEYAVNSDGTGGSRVVQYNWFQHNLEVLGTASGTYDYSDLSNHSAHVAGTVAGNTQGWARSANIYNIYFNTPSVFDFVRAFHNNKPINPETGRKNPTILNNSWGMSYSYDGIDGAGPLTDINYKGVSYPSPTAQDQLDYGFKTASYQNGLPARSAAMDVEVDEAVSDGLIVIGSAGNSGMKMDVSGGVDWNNSWNIDGVGSDFYHRGSSPGAAEGMFCVGSVSHHSVEPKSDFSNCGPRIDIYAPGDNITSSVNSVEYTLTADDPRNSSYKISKIDGTSMASPQVCGLMACVLELYPNMRQADALEYLINYSKANQLSFLNVGGYQDQFDMLGSPDRYLAHHKERPDDGLTFPKTNKDIRPSEGICFPRPRVNLTKPSALEAVGGTITEVDGYRVHTFTVSDTFSILAGYGELEYLVVAGGGGGGTSGANYCGGGGAGGLLQGNLTPTLGDYSFVVGSGGSAQNNGQNSTALGLTSLGGGAGSSSYASAGNAGGSGGGGGPINGTGGTGTAGQGNDGGVASSANQGGQDSGAGGGGGAGTGGQSLVYPGPFSNSPGQGGQGLELGISGTLKWYAAGGVGSAFYSSANVNDIGGSVYGGTANGTVNTGSGGGGGRNGAGGSGGSGIVIVRYKI